MDRPGVRQVSDGSGEQREKKEKKEEEEKKETGCEVICGAQTTLMVKE